MFENFQVQKLQSHLKHTSYNCIYTYNTYIFFLSNQAPLIWWLTLCILEMPNGITLILVNISSDNGLWLDSTKLLPQ